MFMNKVENYVALFQRVKRQILRIYFYEPKPEPP